MKIAFDKASGVWELHGVVEGCTLKFDTALMVAPGGQKGLNKFKIRALHGLVLPEGVDLTPDQARTLSVMPTFRPIPNGWVLLELTAEGEVRAARTR